MSDSIWVAIITASAAIIPQLAITIINKNKEIKLKKFEYYDQNKLDAINEFLETTGSLYIKDGISLKEKAQFEKSVYKLLLYFPSIDSNMISNIFNSLKEWDINKREEIIQPLIKQLSESIRDK